MSEEYWKDQPRHRLAQALTGALARTEETESASAAAAPTYIPGFIESDADRYYSAVISKLRARITQLEASIDTNDRSWRDMADAPTDGTIIEVVGRHPAATAGFPRYVGFRDGKWLQFTTSQEPEEIIPLVWRPRTAFPQFPA